MQSTFALKPSFGNDEFELSCIFQTGDDHSDNNKKCMSISRWTNKILGWDILIHLPINLTGNLGEYSSLALFIPPPLLSYSEYHMSMFVCRGRVQTFGVASLKGEGEGGVE